MDHIGTISTGNWGKRLNSWGPNFEVIGRHRTSGSLAHLSHDFSKSQLTSRWISWRKQPLVRLLSHHFLEQKLQSSKPRSVGPMGPMGLISSHGPAFHHHLGRAQRPPDFVEMLAFPKSIEQCGASHEKTAIKREIDSFSTINMDKKECVLSSVDDYLDLYLDFSDTWKTHGHLWLVSYVCSSVARDKLPSHAKP